MFLISTRKSPIDGGTCGLNESKKYYVINLDNGDIQQVSGVNIIKTIINDRNLGNPCRFINARGTLGFISMSLKTARTCVNNNINISIVANLSGAYNSSQNLNFEFKIKVINDYIIFCFNEFVFPVYIKTNNSVTNIPNSVFSFMGANLSIQDLWSASVVDYQSLEFNFSHIEVLSSKVSFALILSCNDIRDKQVIRVGKVELTKSRTSIDDLSSKSISLSSATKRALLKYDNPDIYTFNKFSCLSNYYSCSVVFDGLQYKSSEAAYQSMKTLDQNLRYKFVDLTPDVAKDLGRQIENSQYLRSDWDSAKYDIMRRIVLTKMQQNPNIANHLLTINSSSIVEDTTGWHDNIWGRCSCDKCRNIRAKNYLGKILVEVRTILRGN